MRFGVRAHRADDRFGDDTCSTGSPESSWSRWTRFLRSHGERSGAKVETMTSSIRSSWIACIAAVYGIRVRDLAVRVDSLAAQNREGAPQAALGLWMVGAVRVALRAEDQEARGRARRTLADAREQRVADDGLVRDHEHVRLTALGRQIDDDVLDRQALSRIANAVDHLSPQPGRALLRMRRDDDLGRLRLEHRDRVAHRVGRIGLDDEPVGRDARLVQRSERPVEAPARPPRAACPRRRRTPCAGG